MAVTDIDWSGLVIDQRRVGSGVRALIEKLIEAGDLVPGDKLPPEREIAAALGTSRASVRDALYELALKGLVDRRPSRGTVVLDGPTRTQPLVGAFSSTRRDLYEIVDLRRVIEPSIAERAAERATPGDIDKLDGVLARVHRDVGQQESIDLDQQFHLALAEAAHNAHLTALVSMTADWIHDLRSRSHATRSGRRQSLDDHRAILDAVVAGDPNAAFAAMTTHVLRIGDIVRQEDLPAPPASGRP